MPLSLLTNGVARAVEVVGRPVVPAILCALCLPASVFYARQTAEYRALSEALQAHVDRDTVVEVGSTILGLVGFGPDGSRVEVPGGSATRMLVFAVSADCSFCLETLDAHKRLATAADTAGMRVVWVSQDSLAKASQSVYATLARPGLLLVEPSQRTYRSVGLGFTPQTLVVAESGVVEAVWRGLLDIGAESEVLGLIGQGQTLP